MATKPSTYLVVLLTDLMAHGDQIPDGTILEVDRAVRNDWVGSKLCRDATDEEIAEYRAEQGGVGTDDLVEDRAQVIADIKALVGDQLEAERKLEELRGAQQDLQAEVEDLGKQKKALADEVEALEKAKKAASK